MSHIKYVRRVVAFSVLVLGSVASAHADTLMLSQNVMVTALSAPKIQSLGAVSAGTVTMSVADLVWPQALQSLSFAVTNNQGVLKSLTGVGSLSYQVLGPMTLFANIYAQPDAAAGAGLYHVNVSFSPAAPAVPLPASVWQLMIAISSLSLAIVRRKGVAVANTIVQAIPISLSAPARQQRLKFSVFSLSIVRRKRATVTNSVVQYA